MGETLLKRIKYLERISERLENFAVYLFAALVASPLIGRVADIAVAALAASIVAAEAAVLLSIYRVRKSIEGLWERALKEDPRFIAFPWDVLALLIISIGMLISILLSG